MDEFKTDTDELPQSPEVAEASPRWAGAQSIGLIHQLNEQCFELVSGFAATAASQALPPFILQNRDLWCRLNSEARKRAAAFPFVIFDIHFKDAEYWQRPGDPHLTSAADSTPSGIPSKLCEDLVLETLLFARQAAREDVNVAKAIFAMTSSVAAQIAVLSLQQVKTIALGNTQQIRLRWDGDLEFWRDFLIACMTADEQALDVLRRQAKLLFCGEFVQVGK